MIPIESFLRRMPKVELHVHLEGSMRPRVLLELARRNGVNLPARDEDGLRKWFRFRDFDHFVNVYLTCSRALCLPEDFQFLARDFLAMQAEQNVSYCEAHFTISTHLVNGAGGEEVLSALEEVISEGDRSGTRLRLIPDIVRNIGPAAADQTLEWALAGRGRGVVAMGLAGIEAGFSNEPYREHFRTARQEGLHCVAHAGEHAGPESIRSVLEVCGAERIGHGVRAVEDPALVEELRDRRIPLEICPTSNLRLGVFPDMASHSFDRLYRAGVEVTVNSDDPPLFDTDLTGEYLALHRTFGYGPAELAGFSLAALRHSFLPAEEKAVLERRFRKEMDELARELFGASLELPVS
jgi:aminodeoxyfutalosine deaminase